MANQRNDEGLKDSEDKEEAKKKKEGVAKNEKDDSLSLEVLHFRQHCFSYKKMRPVSYMNRTGIKMLEYNHQYEFAVTKAKIIFL